ncbi:MAG: hypothetical protein QM652_06335 [Legionella sp.]|uniref:hypothetical protein n=1 Tax=Legionella sp. TaxID=459 RepID=UPI0039E65783
MLKPIKEHGKLFSNSRHQIQKINYYIEKINLYHKAKSQEALNYMDKLLDYLKKLAAEKKISTAVEYWLAENLPEEAKKKIEETLQNTNVRKNIHHISSKAQLSTIYRQYHSKESFRSLIKNKLNQIDASFEVETIKSGNNPLVQVHNDTISFVVRLIRMNKKEEENDVSPRQIREKLGKKMPQITQPFLVEFVHDDGQEITYIEYSELYTDGNLHSYFENLREQREQKNLSADEFDKALFLYAQQMITMLTGLNDLNIWYTDLKPSNILLKNSQISVSDIKGLIRSESIFIASNRTNTSKAYFQSDVFYQEKIDLELLQCQTLATTLYELACGELPEQLEIDKLSWKSALKFNHPVFTDKNGLFLRSIIEQLMSPNPPPLKKFLERFNEQLANMEAHAQGVPLQENNLLPSISEPNTNTPHYNKA